MSTLGLVIIGNFLLSWLVASWAYRNASMLGLVQAPNCRSSHALPTPNGGGIGVVAAGSLAGTGVAILSSWNFGWLVLVFAALIAFTGLKDDIRQLPARVRFAVQLGSCVFLLAALGEMPRLELPFGFWLDGWLLSTLSLVVGVWWINLFNFMDGIDGIAGSQAVFMLLAGAGLAAWYFPESMDYPAWTWMLCIAAATVGFLLLNWPPAKIFMGDVGSTYLAFMIFALALHSVQAGWLTYQAWLVLGGLFVVDATVTLLTRMARGERWYMAHRSHAYQRLSRHWGKHHSVTSLAIGINALWLAPLVCACLLWPQWGWGLLALAYAPLVAGVVALGAGKPD